MTVFGEFPASRAISAAAGAGVPSAATAMPSIARAFSSAALRGGISADVVIWQRGEHPKASKLKLRMHAAHTDASLDLIRNAYPSLKPACSCLLRCRFLGRRSAEVASCTTGGVREAPRHEIAVGGAPGCVWLYGDWRLAAMPAKGLKADARNFARPWTLPGCGLAQLGRAVLAGPASLGKSMGRRRLPPAMNQRGPAGAWYGSAVMTCRS